MNFPHIVFLDFDGPLFSGNSLLLPENNDCELEMIKRIGLNSLVTYWKADAIAIAMLNHLYELRPYFLIISNSWSKLHSKEQIESLLAVNGLNIPLYKNWKIDSDEKIESISNFLKTNKIADYLILDDYDSGNEFLNDKIINKYNINKRNIVLVDFNDGIKNSDFYKMKAIIANWN